MEEEDGEEERRKRRGRRISSIAISPPTPTPPLHGRDITHIDWLRLTHLASFAECFHICATQCTQIPTEPFTLHQIVIAVL